jgi:hypothetical protein
MRKYSGDEIGNLSLGQLGYLLIADGTTYDITNSAHVLTPGSKQWVAIKNVTISSDGVGNIGVTELEVTCFRGETDAHTIYLAAGDTVYGCFKTIEITDTDENSKLLAYYG